MAAEEDVCPVKWLAASQALPDYPPDGDTFLAVNMSPASILRLQDEALCPPELVPHIVIELTEHVPIEDYSAIPRHLQQQYGVYAGHDRGRIYRLTHRDAPRSPAADMSALDAAALARECASPLFWRRQTAQRLLVERRQRKAAPSLRELLGDKRAEPSGVISALRTLDQLGVLTPADVEPFIRNAAAALGWRAARRPMAGLS